LDVDPSPAVETVVFAFIFVDEGGVQRKTKLPLQWISFGHRVSVDEHEKGIKP
jgi:hypothetical protein